MKPESKLARRRRIAARIDDLTEQAQTCARWAAGYRAEAEALKVKLAELEGKSPLGYQCKCVIDLGELPQQRGKEQLHGLPY